MTERELSINVRLSCQRALCGAITPNVRLITVGWNNLDLFHLRAYFGEAPTDDEVDEMDAVSTEVISDIPFERDKVECLMDTRLRKDLDLLKAIVYASKE